MSKIEHFRERAWQRFGWFLTPEEIEDIKSRIKKRKSGVVFCGAPKPDPDGRRVERWRLAIRGLTVVVVYMPADGNKPDTLCTLYSKLFRGMDKAKDEFCFPLEEYKRLRLAAAEAE